MAQEAQEDPWEAYLGWNRAIAEQVFPKGANGGPVYLQLDEEDLRRLGDEMRVEEPLHAFRVAVRRTLNLTDTGGVFERQARAVSRWKAQTRDESRPEPPPCIGLLSIFVLAAERMHSGEGMSGNNYYDRLLQELEVPDLLRPALRDQISAQFRSHSPRFWDALARWLRYWEGERGQPTATSVGGYSYVGVPISQALVRSQDRSHLHELFAQRGYRPDHPPGRDRLARDLDRWIHQAGSPSSKALRDLWDRGQSDAITDIVIQEIGAWKGPAEGEHPERDLPRSRVSLGIQFRSQGLRELPRLFMLVAGLSDGEGRASYPLALEEGEDGPEADPGLELRRLKVPGWYAIEPAEEVVGSMGLLAQLSFEVPDLEVRLARDPRPLLPLRWEEGPGAYVEADRMDRDGRFLVLCRAQWAEEIGQLLDHISAGEARSLGEGVGEVPEGWVLFGGVTPARWDAPEGMDTTGLSDLVPEPDRLFRVAGGLPLPGVRTWHVLRPPGVAVVSEDRSVRLRLRAGWRWPRPDGDPREETIAEGGWVLQAKLSEFPAGLKDGDLALEVQEGSSGGPWRTVERSVVHLRSGSTPRELGADQAHPLALPLRPVAGALTLIDLATESDQGPVALGARVLADPAEALAAHPGAPGPLGDDGSRSIPPHRPGWLPISPELKGEHDVLLDALSYARAGSWRRFQELAGRVRRGYRFAYRAAERLSGLGHMEVGRVRPSMRPHCWAIAPPTIVRVPGEEQAFLAGLRSRAVVDTLQAVVEELDGFLQGEPARDGPMTLRIMGLGRDELELVASEASDRLGMEVAVSEAPWEALVESARPLSGILASLPEVNLPEPGGLQAFDVDVGQWRSAPERVRPGALRLRRSPRIYGVAAAEDLAAGRMRAADPALAHLLAFALAGRKIVDWERDRGRLRSLRGLPLPGPLERAAVICSGRPPRVEGQQRSYYGVPAELGDRIDMLLSVPIQERPR